MKSRIGSAAKAVAHIAVFGIVAGAPAASLAENVAFQPDKKLQGAMAGLHKRALKAAAKLEKKDPIRYGQFVPAGAELSPGIREVSYTTAGGDGTAVVESLQQTVAGLGHLQLTPIGRKFFAHST